jgi:hypothetical protein
LQAKNLQAESLRHLRLGDRHKSTFRAIASDKLVAPFAFNQQKRKRGVSPLRRTILLGVLLGVILVGALKWRNVLSARQTAEAAEPTIIKQPVALTNRAFDAGNPPEDMPPLASGENAACDSNFLSNASVAGESQQTDATHAIVTVTRITVTLQLNITIWLPGNASQHVIEHEAGHRRISEYYYRDADKLAKRIAAAYMGKQVAIAGTDLRAEMGNALQRMGTEITDEYNKELNPGPTQLRYDAITDHSRNDVAASDAVAQALNERTPAPATGS